MKSWEEENYMYVIWTWGSRVAIALILTWFSSCELLEG